MQEASGRFKQFSLSKKGWFVLPERHSLVVDRVAGTLTLIDWQHERIVAVCEDLDDEQFSLLLSLLERWPSYISYEELLRQLGIEPTSQDLADLERVRWSGRMSRSRERAMEQARARLQPTLQTLRDLLGACKLCLRSLGIDIVAVLDYGPILIPYADAMAPQEQSAG